MRRTACTEPQCLYNGTLYLYLYLYSPYGPYGLYRASVPVQWCTVPLPIPLLPLWTVQPVHSFSACTTAHCTFILPTDILVEPKDIIIDRKLLCLGSTPVLAEWRCSIVIHTQTCLLHTYIVQRQSNKTIFIT